MTLGEPRASPFHWRHGRGGTSANILNWETNQQRDAQTHERALREQPAVPGAAPNDRLLKLARLVSPLIFWPRRGLQGSAR